MRMLFAALLSLLSPVVVPALAQAQTFYPARPITIRKINPGAIPVRRTDAPGAGVEHVPDCA